MPDDVQLPSQQVAALSPEAHAHWRLTGEINPKASAPPPDVPHQDLADEPADTSTYAESSPAEPAEQAPEIAGRNEAASEPATPKKKSNAETRKAELNAEILALKRERDQLAAERARLTAEPSPAPKTDVTPESSPASEPKSLAAFVASPDLTKPRIDEVEFFAQFPDAKLADYQDYRENYRDRLSEIKTTATNRVETLSAKYRERIQTAIEADPELWNKIPDDLKLAKATGITLPVDSKQRTPMTDLARELMLSEHAGVVLSHLAEHPDEVQKFKDVPDENSLIRAFARLEARLTSDSVNPPKAVRPRTTTSAPEPPRTTVGRRTEGVIDDAEGAVQRKDAGSYIAIMNRREAGMAR